MAYRIPQIIHAVKQQLIRSPLQQADGEEPVSAGRMRTPILSHRDSPFSTAVDTKQWRQDAGERGEPHR